MRLPNWPWQISAPAGEEGGSERWLITYADMITLLLVMFIVLYSTANTDLEKFKALADSLTDGFGATSAGARTGTTGEAAGGSPIWDTSGGGASPLQLFPEHQTPIEIFQFAEMLEGMGEEGGFMEELRGLVEEAVAAAEEAGVSVGELGAGVEVEYNERGIRIIIFPDQILFRSGSAQLLPEFKAILDQLYVPISRLSNRVEIQGHTDNVPIHTATYPSNWELSAGRAGAVIRYFEAKGLSAARLQAAGYADTVPIASNDTRQGRQRNRRVELLILREEGESLQRWQQERSLSAAPAVGTPDATVEQPPSGAVEPAGQQEPPAAQTEHSAAPEQPAVEAADEEPADEGEAETAGSAADESPAAGH